MAQRVQIILEDDLDGTEASETVSFALDGTSYEIDLNEQHAADLREALAPYVGHARKVTGRGGRRGGRSTSSSSSAHTAKEIRDWARSNGFDVPDRGRIPGEVRAAFEAAH